MSSAALDAVGGRIARIDALMASLRGPEALRQASPAAVSSSSSAAAAGSSRGSFAAALQSASGVAPAAAAGWSASPASAAGTASTASTAGTASAAAAGLPFGAEIDAAAGRNGVPPMLLAGVVRQESGFDPSARSGAGAVGLTQLMPATAAGLGVGDPTDPVQSLEGGARYLRQQLDRFGGDRAKALAAYNAGPAAVQRFGGVPPYAETQNYVRSILSRLGSA